MNVEVLKSLTHALVWPTLWCPALDSKNENLITNFFFPLSPIQVTMDVSDLRVVELLVKLKD